MGRDALRQKLRRIVVTYDSATAPASNDPNGLRFADSVMTINVQPFTNPGDVRDRAAAMTKLPQHNL